jgi:hypothetical protein
MALNHTQISASDLRAEFATLQSDYRNTNRDLASASRKGDKLSVKTLTRAKKRISERMDKLKNQIENSNTY